MRSEPDSIHLDPLTAQQHQAISAGEQGGDLLCCEPLAVERHIHAEIQHTFEAKFGWRARTDSRGDLRTGRAAGAPSGGHAHDNAGTFQLRHAGEQA